MAINFNNQNQGIGSINLGDFGLQQPEENMTVAEAINYGVLPQSQESFTPKSTMITGSVVDRFMNENPNATKGDFVNALQSGSLGVGGSQLFDKNVGSLFEGVDLGKAGMFSFGGVDPTLKGTTDGTFRNTLDIDRGALSPEALESLPEGFFKGVGDQSSLGLPTNDRLAMAISNYDQLFGPRTMSDANQSLYTGVMDRSGTPIDYTDRIRQQNLPGFASEPQYTIRGQLAKDLSKDGIPKDFIDGLKLAGSELNQDFGNIKGKIGAGFNNLIDNPVTRGLGTAFNFAKGSLPGLIMSGIGSLFNRDPKAPSYQQYSPQSYLKENNLSNIYNANPSMINDFYDSNEDSDTFGTTRFDRAVPGSFASFRTLSGYLNRDKVAAKAARAQHNRARKAAKAQEISLAAAKAQQQAIINSFGTGASSFGGSRGDYGNPGGTSGEMTDANAGTYCFDPSTPIQMTDGSTKEIKNIQLGDNTKGGEVTGVFQFKATDEIHDYKGVTVAGSHYVKEDGRFIMVKDSPLSIKIDKIPVVYSLDTTGRRIFINDIEFADYNGDGVAKNFLSNAGVDITGFDTEVLRQVEQRLI